MADEPDDYDIPLEGYEAALGNDLSALQARIEELEAKLAWVMEGLPQMKSDLEYSDYNSAYPICKHILEQLTGGKDD